MVASKIKKVTNSVTSFEVGKMYVQEAENLVVVYMGEGDHFSTFRGVVLHREGFVHCDPSYGWKIFDESHDFARAAFTEFHGEITLTS